MATNAVTLGELKTVAMTAITASEQSLKEKLASISSGDEITNMDLLGYQMELASNSLTSGTCSAIAKERADTLKSVLQRF